ncbi:prolyl 4-hydroxylase subunit alpha-2 [Rhagoletis pomonella]|uniref:prolyl 4-hydroxylase subunit alpha-2 n=1 Tax=Rhagoletis pomonella TaxID=28610 RepID=UPI0017800D4A|nr:prolyl 4-hydroxylase subunit alpha-2 [Rhagoletis pomonella]
MKSLQLVALSILTVFSRNTNGDYYTSITSLGDLLQMEIRVTSNFEKYMEAMEEISRQVNDTLKHLERFVQDAGEDLEDYYGNPLNAYKIINRFVLDWQNLNKTIFDERPAQAYLQNQTMLLEEGYSAPTNEDLLGASKGLARLQRTYRQETVDVAEGDLMGFNFSENFTASECYWLGSNLYEAGEYKYAAEWLIQARVRLAQQLKASNGTSEVAEVTDVHVLAFLAASMYYLGKGKLALHFNDELLIQDPLNSHGLESRARYSERAFDDRHGRPVETLDITMSKRFELDSLFDSVCNGDLQQTPGEKRDLRCRYVHNNVPFCFIAPFRKEELSQDPPVAYYHEVIYDSEIERILNETEHNVQRSMVDNGTFSDVRTSQNTWIDFEEHSFLNNLAQRLRDITGLILETAELLQVANYGIGGHYGAHYDFAEETGDVFDGRGNRLLTALFYINDVELGGATAFPYLRLAVPPIKRSMVVWYNMHESLELDYRTKHGGCPVLVGSKWICNEWFHEAHQEFTRPCGLERDGYKSLKFKDLY